MGDESTDVEHLDVVVVGAGLSGIGAACRLELERPGTSYAVLEARDAVGGTWDLFRYPGVRSDSDMHTLGYPFRPWLEAKRFADGPSILRYVEETAHEFGVDRRVRLHHRVVAADWSSDTARWRLTVHRTDTDDLVELTCSFLLSCTGYYRYDHGHEPEIPGRERYVGTVVHPQQWPGDLDVAGRRVAVVGSGATAVTLVPALVERGAEVVLVQRSPTYIASLPSTDRVAELAGRVLPARTAYRVVRSKNRATAGLSYRLSKRWPGLMRRLLVDGVRKQLPEGYDVARDFEPSYDPWDQRLCVAPDGDLFAAIRSGHARVVTGRIERFTTDGLRMDSGAEVGADVVVTATGLELLLVGGTVATVDGEPLDPPSLVAYKGLMLSGVPNFAFEIGYTNASWTLKCDLVARHVCRLLAYMDEQGYDVVVAQPPPEPDRAPLIDLSSGYVRRGLPMLPKQGVRAPWRLDQSYRKDVRTLLRRPVADEGVRFLRRSAVEVTR